MPNPASSGTGFFDVSAWLKTMGEQGGWKYMDALHENVAQYTHSGSKPCRQAGAGEFVVGISFDFRGNDVKQKGAPVELVFPKEGLGWDIEASAIMKNTKKMDAAKKLMDWVATKEANEAYSKNFAIVSHPDVKPALANIPADLEKRLIKSDFGIVFQSYALFPNLTVADNVAYGLVNRKVPRADRAARVKELLALVGLPDSGAKFPGQLSGGQQQRIAIARALATSPGLLLLDEPLSALDARVRVRLRGEIRALQQRLGITTILVTHDQEEALSMADRIVVMKEGAIEQLGSPSEVYLRPATPFVADFVGKTNLLPAQASGARAIQVGAQRFECEVEWSDFKGARGLRLFFRPEDVMVRGVNG